MANSSHMALIHVFINFKFCSMSNKDMLWL